MVESFAHDDVLWIQSGDTMNRQPCRQFPGGRLLLAMLFLLAALSVRAQVSLSLSSAPNPVVINRQIVYQLRIVNQDSVLQSGAVVTNFLPEGVDFVGASANTISFTNVSGAVAFRLRDLEVSEAVTLSVTGRPTRLGMITNIARARGSSGTLVSATNTTEVQNMRSDLAVGLSSAELAPLVGQSFSYQVAVTNFGPDAISAIEVQTPISTNLALIGITPSTVTFAQSNNVVRVQIGGLATNTFSGFTVSVRATNSGVTTLSASIPTAVNDDLVTTNNAASVSIAVTPVVDADLTVAESGPGVFDPQTGLIRHVFRVTNDGTNAVAGARIFVNGLTNRLVNVAGTNLSRAFVTLAAPLSPGASVDLVLEYFSPNRIPVPLGTIALEAVAIIPQSQTVPDGDSIPVRLAALPDGRVLIEFASDAGGRYRVVYSAAASFTNSLVAVPDVEAPANRTQWIDEGPPKTASRPAGSGTRFYRVLQVSQ